MAKLEKSFQALKKGDERAFSEIYRKTHRLVYYTVYEMLKDEEAAKDIVQDAYLRVHKKISSYRSGSPKAWILTIARNLAINEYNRRKRVVFLEEEKIDYFSGKPRKDTPLIDLAAKNLPEDEFMILMLCVCERYKRREVAEIMKLSVSGVTWKLNRALDKLRKLAKEAEL